MTLKTLRLRPVMELTGLRVQHKETCEGKRMDGCLTATEAPADLALNHRSMETEIKSSDVSTVIGETVHVPSTRRWE
jgi:hypothetical protein